MIHKESLCIMCGCCVSECNSMEADPGLPRAGGAREGDALRRRRARPGDGRAAAVVLGRARDLGLHALLLLPGALPEGRRPARRDREARRRGDEGGHRLRHGREAREVVRHVREDDRLAAGDRARAEDAGRREVAQGGQVRDGALQARQGAAARPAARREARRASRARSTTSSGGKDATAPPGIVQSEHALVAPRVRARERRRAPRPVRARTRSRRRCPPRTNGAES